MKWKRKTLKILTKRDMEYVNQSGSRENMNYSASRVEAKDNL